ncbi:MAG: L,D-transpeptidase family protein [Candidatus Binatia bacterium]|jgi:murein L,D-transpeptidase YafK
MTSVMRRSSTRWIFRSLSVLAGLCLSGCSLGESALPQPVDVSGAPVDASPQSARNRGFLPWAEEQGELIIVDKASRRLVLYRHGEPVKSYPVVLGRNPGRKRFEGDRRTPSGLYQITDKRPHAKYDRFLAFNYPNERDLTEYRAALSRNPAPVLGRHIGPGGLLGIHGSDSEVLNRTGVNWTFGCVSLMNRDVEELYAEVREGTPVLIRDEQQP